MPSVDRAIRGLFSLDRADLSRAMPAMAMAPFSSTAFVILLRPERSQTEWSIMMSLVPTKARVFLEAMVEIMIFGSPTGKERMTPVPRVVPMEPPKPMMP